MDKKTKLQYQQRIEGYLEENHVYEIFEQLMKSVIIKQPTDPIGFLIEKLSKPESKRVFIVGPPGINTKEVALFLEEQFQYNCLDTGDLLDREIKKKSDLGKVIAEAQKTFSFCEDQIVTQVIQKAIDGVEKEHRSWTVSGFPKTRVQALQFQKAGILPDYFILLNASKKTSLDGLKEKLKKRDDLLNTSDDELHAMASNAVEEYFLHIEGVKDVCRGFIYEVDADGQRDNVLTEVSNMLKVKIKSNAPRRPPRVLLLGPPGSGRTEQARKIAAKFGLIYVSTSHLLKNEAAKKTRGGLVAFDMMENGELVPDDIVMSLVDKRLDQSDCRINGWVLDGYPKTPEQLQMFQNSNYKPSHVIVLNLGDSVVYERLEHRRLDRETGRFYNTLVDPPEEVEVLERLIQKSEDRHEIVKRRLKNWKAFLPKLESEFESKIMTILAERKPEDVTDAISDAIEGATN